MPRSFILESLEKDLQLTSKEVDSIVSNVHKMYRIFPIKKKGSTGYRFIHSPSPEAKLIQTWLAHKFFAPLDRSINVYAFRKDCSIVKNAEAHSDSLFLLKYDLENFFPSIHHEQFLKFLKTKISIFCNEVQADFKTLEELIKAFCFLKDGNLPQGFCSSPVISNVFMGIYDSYIEQELKKISTGIVFTRYADDISISFSDINLKLVIETFVESFFANGKCPFKINFPKKRFGKLKSGSMFVNGIKICHDGRLTIHRKYKDKIRRLFYAYEKKILSLPDKKSLLGHLFYLRSVDAKYYNKIYKLNFNIIKELRAELSMLKN